MRLVRFGAVAMAAGATLLAGCGGSSTSVTSATSSTSSTSSSASDSMTSSSSGASQTSESSSASSSSAAAQGAVPSGYKLVTASTTKISFAVPSSWTTLDATKVGTPAFKAAIEPIAKKMGTTADALTQQLQSNVDLFVIAPTSSSGSSENTNVQKRSYPASSGLPDETSLKDAIASIGATEDGYAKKSTPLGEAVEEDYHMTMSGKQVHGAILFVPNGVGGFSDVTVTATSQSRATELAGVILSTLRASS